MVAKGPAPFGGEARVLGGGLVDVEDVLLRKVLVDTFGIGQACGGVTTATTPVHVRMHAALLRLHRRGVRDALVRVRVRVRARVRVRVRVRVRIRVRVG